MPVQPREESESHAVESGTLARDTALVSERPSETMGQGPDMHGRASRRRARGRQAGPAHAREPRTGAAALAGIGWLLLTSLSFQESPSSSQDDLIFLPSMGSGTRYELREFTRWSLKGMKRVRDGIDTGEPSPELEGSNKLRLRYRDHFVDVAPMNRVARPLHLVRQLEEIGGNFELAVSLGGENDPQSFEWSSPYEGWQLDLSWAPSEETYTVKHAGGELEYPTLSSRADLSVLLPEEYVPLEPGSSWRLSERALFDLFRPLGELALEPAKLAPGPYKLLTPLNLGAAGVLSLRELGRGVRGSATVRWHETREVLGQPVAVLKLALELEVDADNTPAFTRLIAATRVDPAWDELRMRSSGKLSGKGEVLWDLTRYEPKSLALDLEFDLLLDLSWYDRQAAGQTSMHVEALVEGSSELRWTLENAD